MSQKTLKYELSGVEVNFILNALNKVQVSGVKTAEGLVAVTRKLQSPTNAEELEKDQLEELKAKYEKKEK